MIRSYKDLEVWKRALKAAVDCYRLSKDFPREEIYGIISQLRRASVSVALNISEGNSRSGRKDYARFLSMARGSVAEVQTCLLIAVQLGYVNDVESQSKEYDELSRMLYSMIRKLNES